MSNNNRTKSGTMCTVKKMTIGDRTIHVADIKMKYIKNIVAAAKDCDYIDKVVLFGSAIKNNCRTDSDIDLAVFGNKAKGKALTSFAYRNFIDQIYAFDDFEQTYDILYFKSGAKNDFGIMEDIEQGEVLYAR